MQTDLTARIEAATRADRLLDANIHWRVKREDFEADDDHTDASYCYARSGWTMNRADHAFLNLIGVPRYTGSIDAAMTLVPDDLVWHISGGYRRGGYVSIESRDDRVPEFKGRAATPALALCAAALKAHDKGGV